VPPADENTRLLGEEASNGQQAELPKNRVARIAPIILCFSNASFLTAIALCVVKAALFGVFDATVPLHADDLFHFDAFERGLLFVPFTCVRLAGAPLGGWVVDQYGPKAVATVGYAFLVPVLVMFRCVHSEPRQEQIVLYGILLGLTGLGTSIVASSSFVTANAVMRMYHLRNPALFGERPPSASLNGIYLTAFNVGLSLGPVLASTLLNTLSYGNMNAVLAGITGLSAIAASLWLIAKPDPRAT